MEHPPPALPALPSSSVKAVQVCERSSSLHVCEKEHTLSTMVDMANLSNPIRGPELRSIRERVGVSMSAMARLLGVTGRELDAFESQSTVAVEGLREGHPALTLVPVYEALASVVEAAEGFRRRGA